MNPTLDRLIKAYESGIGRLGKYVLAVPLLLMAVIETLNAVGRKLLVPLPFAVESVESLLVICVYFGVVAVAMEGGHINVEVLTAKLSKRTQSAIDAACNVLGAAVFGFIAYGAWLGAADATRMFEIRTGVDQFYVWPFRIAFAAGLTLLTIQLAINAIKHAHVAAGRLDHAVLRGDKVKSMLGET